MTDTEKKPRVYWHNWMGMHRDLEEAKCWTPESELEDLRQYVELAAYDALAKQLDELKAELKEESRLNGIGSEREARLETKLKIAEEALAFYADKTNYDFAMPGKTLFEDAGRVAHKALARMRGEEK